MLEEVIAYMKLPHWQTVLRRRPLLPMLFPTNFEAALAKHTDPAERIKLPECVAYIRTRAKAAGLLNPPIERISHQNHAASYMAAGFDAISDYSGGYGGAMCTRGEGPSYETTTQTQLATYKADFYTAKITYIPPMQNHLYQWPRFQHAETTAGCTSSRNRVTRQRGSSLSSTHTPGCGSQRSSIQNLMALAEISQEGAAIEGHGRATKLNMCDSASG
jgi:hypothetical protein